MNATVGFAIACDRLRLYGNNSLCDRLRSALYDPRSSAIVSDHMETSLHEDGALRKRSSKPGEFENAGFSFLVWTENILETELFENDGVSIIT